jgi:hypothetical protein
MRRILALTLVVTSSVSGFGQDITVHVVNDETKKPLKGT